MLSVIYKPSAIRLDRIMEGMMIWLFTIMRGYQQSTKPIKVIHVSTNQASCWLRLLERRRSRLEFSILRKKGEYFIGQQGGKKLSDVMHA